MQGYRIACHGPRSASKDAWWGISALPRSSLTAGRGRTFNLLISLSLSPSLPSFLLSPLPPTCSVCFSLWFCVISEGRLCVVATMVAKDSNKPPHRKIGKVSDRKIGFIRFNISTSTKAEKKPVRKLVVRLAIFHDQLCWNICG